MTAIQSYYLFPIILEVFDPRLLERCQSLGIQYFLFAETGNTGIQGGLHYRFGLKTDLEATLDILSEDSRIDDVVSDLTESRLQKNYCSYPSF